MFTFKFGRFYQAAVMLGSLLAAGAASAQDTKLGKLLQTAPAGVNSVAYLNPPALKRLMKEAEMEMAVTLSERVQELWLTSRLDVIELVPQWEAGFATIDGVVQPDELVSLTGGYADRVGTRDVIWTPRQSYLFPLADQRIGFLRPANRSLLADWLSGDRGAAPSSFLAAQTHQPEEFLSLLLAIDLNDVFSPVALTKRLRDFESLRQVDTSTAAQTLASIRGISILVGRRSLKEFILSAEFGMDPAPLAPHAGAILNEILERNDTSAPEVASWKVTVKGNVLSLQGPISEDSLIGLLGVFSLQGHAESLATADTDRSKESASGDPNEPNRYETQRYFNGVIELIERVRKYSTKSTGYRAKWNDQQARRIDELPTLRVDPAMIKYGTDVAGLLRDNALAIRGGNIGASSVKASQTLSSGYYTGGYGNYIDPNSGVDYQRVTDVQARASATMDYTTTLSTIDQLSGEIRRIMTEKYQTQF